MRLESLRLNYIDRRHRHTGYYYLHICDAHFKSRPLYTILCDNAKRLKHF